MANAKDLFAPQERGYGHDVKYLAKIHLFAQQDGHARCFNPYRYKRSSAPQERRCGQQRKISGQIPYSGTTGQACWRDIFGRRQRFVYFAGARVRPTTCLAKLHSVAPCDGCAGCFHSRWSQRPSVLQERGRGHNFIWKAAVMVCPAGASAEASRLSAGLASRRVSKACAFAPKRYASRKNRNRPCLLQTKHGRLCIGYALRYKKDAYGRVFPRRDLALVGARLEVLFCQIVGTKDSCGYIHF